MNNAAVLDRFKAGKVATIAQLTCWLSCSESTAHRRLKSWGAFTSYNGNGRYYTLPEIASFDSNGLWQHQGIFFSQYGNLKQTLIHLVNHSEKGLSGPELGEILGLQSRSFLSHFRDHPALYRENIMERWIWFANDPLRREGQKQNRLSQITTIYYRMPSDMEAVMILVDLIKHPNSRLGDILRRLKPQGFSINVSIIRQLLVHHDLLKKKADLPAFNV